jgi:GT2 family glycosyltransferase
MYGEDLEWCERIKASGWEIYYLDGLQVLHQRGASTREAHGVSTLWLRGADDYFKRKYGSRRAAMLHLVEACGFSLRLIGYKGWGYLGGGWRYHRRAEEMKAYLRASLSLFKAAVAD